MKQIRNIQLKGSAGKPLLTDLFFHQNKKPKPIVIFAHGYKGYKDWGCWNLMAKSLADENFFIIKFNFSHNGGSPDQPIDFPDLKAFGLNNYSKELYDLGQVIDWAYGPNDFEVEMDRNSLTLIGHSRGGGIVTIKASEDKRVGKLISWAGVADFERRFPKGQAFNDWQRTGVYHVLNGRTKQHMPHEFQFYQDFEENRKRLSIKRAAKQIKIPHLIIHGTGDSSVSFQEAEELHGWNPSSQLYPVSDAGHTFDCAQPWAGKQMPAAFKEVLERSISFCKA